MNGLEGGMAETHISWIFFVGDRAYKLKKPIKTAFLDFSTVESRRSSCHREVELNRRLAPDVYLGVAEILGPTGEPWDYLVMMRRMPPDRRLSELIAQGEPLTQCLSEVARTVAAFHSNAQTSPEISKSGSPDATWGRWESNVSEMRKFEGGVVDAQLHSQIARLARRYIDGRAPLFESRIGQSRIRDGHGDLLADDIYCLEDGPRILDCIEFDDKLRHVDVLDDSAFLAMDLERLGATTEAENFLERYRQYSADQFPMSLAHHYIAYRAHVRAKVACLRHEQGDEEAATEARHLLTLSHRHLALGQVMLVLVGGLPGSGKSTLSKGLGEALGGIVLRSDEVRKELAGVAKGSSAAAPYREGIYRPNFTEMTYRTLLDRARMLLGKGETVVLDASWADSRWRAGAHDVAESTASVLVQIRCHVDMKEAARRIGERAEAGGDASDANVEVAQTMAAEADPWPDAMEVETSSSKDATLQTALSLIQRATRP